MPRRVWSLLPLEDCLRTRNSSTLPEKLTVADVQDSA